MRFTFCLLFALHAAPLAAETVTGPARVIDGDTVEIGGLHIRLHGIDTPESGQICETGNGVRFDCGAVATSALSEMIGRGSVACSGSEIDRYGRLVAVCRTGQHDLNAEMVEQGYALAYLRYSSDYLLHQDRAKAAGRGFWSGTMQAPSAYRAEAKDPVPASGCAFKGNISSGGRIVHAPGQEHYDRTVITESKGERWFCSLAEAQAAGWRPARR